MKILIPIPLEGGLSGLCSAICSGPADKNSNRFSFIGAVQLEREMKKEECREEKV